MNALAIVVLTLWLVVCILVVVSCWVVDRLDALEQKMDELVRKRLSDE